MKRDMEGVVANVLRGGVLLSVMCIVLGLVLLVSYPGSASSVLHEHSYRSLVSEKTVFPYRPRAVIRGLFQGQGVAYIMLGVLLLVLTPVARVISSVLIFRQQHDGRMTLVTLFVAVVLLSSFVVGMFS